MEEKVALVSKVKEVIYNTLNRNHIQIPFPQQDVYIRHLEMPKNSFQVNNGLENEKNEQ